MEDTRGGYCDLLKTQMRSFLVWSNKADIEKEATYLTIGNQTTPLVGLSSSSSWPLRLIATLFATLLPPGAHMKKENLDGLLFTF